VEAQSERVALQRDIAEHFSIEFNFFVHSASAIRKKNNISGGGIN
jgi:hypothetical protein